MSTYKELDTLLHHKRSKRPIDSRKVANNTYVERRGSRIAVRLHRTDVVTFTADNKVVLDTGGWYTVTTKDRINTYLPNDMYVSSREGAWCVSRRIKTGKITYSDWDTDKKYPWEEINHEYLAPFANGIEIDLTNNKVDGVDFGLHALALEVDKHTKKKITRYMQGLSPKRWQEVLNEGGAGDCILCMTGDKDREHLMTHLDERYYMISLTRRALIEGGHMRPEYFIGSCPIVKSELRKYFYKHLLVGPHTGNIPTDVLNRWVESKGDINAFHGG